MKWTDEQKEKLRVAAKARWARAKEAGQKTLKNDLLFVAPKGAAYYAEAAAKAVSEGRLSVTDQKFWSWRPGFYEFTKDGEWDRHCKNCHESFKTRLEFNKFCSPNCKEEWTGSRKTRGA